MERKAKSKSFKAIMIASISAMVVAVGVLTAFIIVLALPTNIETAVSIGYTATDVSATVEGYYKAANANQVQLGTLNFEYNTPQETQSLDLNTSMRLNNGNNSYVIFKYKITNTGDAAFDIKLLGVPNTNNMSVQYLVTTTDSYPATGYSNVGVNMPITLATNVTRSSVKYVYIKVAVSDYSAAASLTGNFNFKLEVPQTQS